MTATPLVVVVIISMIKDKFEDNKRRKQDTAENTALVDGAPRGAK